MFGKLRSDPASPVSDAIVYIVDDDESVRRALTRLIKSQGWRVAALASAREFLDMELADGPGCVLLDLKMPGMSGLELQEELLAREVELPIVFMTAHGDVPSSVKAMKAGAFDFLPKPLDNRRLAATVGEAIERHADQRERAAGLELFLRGVRAMSELEQNVMSLLAEGLSDDLIAERLGLTTETLEVCRKEVVHKTGVRSIAELARLCERAGILADR